MSRRRWSDNDRNFGPFTYSNDQHGRTYSIVLDSGEDEYPGCSLRLRGFGHTFIINLPRIIQPWRRKIQANWDADHRCEYGFSLSDGFLQVFLGAQTGDSTTEKNWCCRLPWQDWRFARFSLYDLSGNHFWTELEKHRVRGIDHFKAQWEAKDRTPKAIFVFKDFDDEEITATTYIEEREWRFGTKWCKWLSVFRRAKISRDLSIEFSAETGRRKGSWKGGTVGHSIELLPGELHESAFRRYCTEHEMTFVAARAGDDHAK